MEQRIIFENGVCIEVTYKGFKIIAADGSKILLDKCGNLLGSTDNSEQVRAGQYVKYRPAGSWFGVHEESTGIPKTQLFEVFKSTLWMLFRDIDGEWEIIPVEPVGALELCGKESFKNVVKILNDISSAFVNPKYAISGRSFGSTEKSVNTIKTPITAEHINYLGVKKGGKKRPINYSYTDKEHLIDLEHAKRININIPGNIFLGSRATICSSMSHGVEFAVRILGCKGGCKTATLYFDHRIPENYRVGERSEILGVLPVIRLKKDIVFSKGNGSYEEPWEIGI